MKRAHSSGAISSICTTRRMWSARTVDIPTAALLTSTSRRPKRAIVRLTLSRQAAGADTSRGSARVRSAPSSPWRRRTPSSDVSQSATRMPAATKARARGWPMPPAAPVMSAMRPSRSGADMGLPIEWRGKFLDHLHDFARALDARSPDTIELGDLCSQRCRVQDVLGLFDTWELIEGDVNERVGPAPGAPSSLSLELLYSARKMFCPIPTIELLPIGQVGQSCPNDENGCSHGRLLGGLFLRNWQ